MNQEPIESITYTMNKYINKKEWRRLAKKTSLYDIVYLLELEGRISKFICPIYYMKEKKYENIRI